MVTSKSHLGGKRGDTQKRVISVTVWPDHSHETISIEFLVPRFNLAMDSAESTDLEEKKNRNHWAIRLNLQRRRRTRPNRNLHYVLIEVKSTLYNCLRRRLFTRRAMERSQDQPGGTVSVDILRETQRRAKRVLSP